MEHTPLPWEVKDFRDVSAGRHDDVFVAAAATPDHPYYNGTRSIEILSEENYPRKRADAAFMCRAANSHYTLLEALKAALPALEAGREFQGETLEVVAQVREAISKAEGQQ